MHTQGVLLELLKSECTASEFQWVQEKLATGARGKKLGFVMAHRFISNEMMSAQTFEIKNSPYSIDLSLWTLDRLARVILLLSLDTGDKVEFAETIETLFKTADNRESEALYGSIPLLNYPDEWKSRATEAIRSNVGLIFDAMAFNNPYPAQYFEENAWNQLVLKTIFNHKSIWRITGLENRRNQELATAISDFAHERWAAYRTLPPEVWYLTEPFPGERYWNDVELLLASDRPVNHRVGYLLWKPYTSLAPAPINKKHEDIFSKLSKEKFDWKNIHPSVVSQ